MLNRPGLHFERGNQSYQTPLRIDKDFISATLIESSLNLQPSTQFAFLIWP